MENIFEKINSHFTPIPVEKIKIIMNWREILKVGTPTDANKSYLVTDGKEVSTTNISITKNYSTGADKFNGWTGDENTYEDNQCCSGERLFDLTPTHWMPTDEIDLP